MVAVHHTYLRHGQRVLDNLDTRIGVPRPPTTHALRQILGRRVRWFTEDTAYTGASVNDVFESAALEALHRWYQDGRAIRLRDVVRVAHVALTEACDARSHRITTPLLRAAIAAC